VQLKRTHGAAFTLALSALCATRARAASVAEEASLYSMFRLFTDSGGVRVRAMSGDYSAPLGHGAEALSLHWNNEQVTIPAIAAPAGSQDAIDAITTASRPIEGNAFEDYVKTRNELTAEVDRSHAGAEYYVSREVDYLGQQLGLHTDRDFRDQTLNLAVSTSYGWDAITPLADERSISVRQHKNTLHGSVVATQVLSPTTLVRGGIEVFHVEGLQHNIYRNVYAGGTRVPERHPSTRERRDAFVKLSHYMANRSSIKADYRLYNDDWGITSHELSADLSQYVTHALSTSWEYRWYTQGKADFYAPEYASVNGIGGYRTADYRMNDLASHLFGVSLHLDMDGFAAAHPHLGAPALWLHYERYFNSNNYSANILETGLELRFQ
jgi:hypothetical protein